MNLAEVTKDYLDSELHRNSYPESLSSIEKLLKLNDLGFVTHSSQPGLEYQRAYVCGYIKSEVALRLELEFALALNSTEIFCAVSGEFPNWRVPVTIGCANCGRELSKGVLTPCRCEFPTKEIRTRIAPFSELGKLKGHMAIVVIDMRWGRQGLLDKIIEVLSG